MTVKIPFKNVVKRDGRIVPFDIERIVRAVQKAMLATREGNSQKDPEKVAERAVRELIKKYPASHAQANEVSAGRKMKTEFSAHSPHIEEIQDVVEESLILMDFPKTAKAYILYRAERARTREEQRQKVSEEVKEHIRESSKYFDNPYQEFIFYQFYSRWRDDLGRRETWVETVDRYMDFMRENLGDKLSDKEYGEVREAILHREICPSMRLLWSSGEACRRSNVTSYNCLTGDTEMLTKEFGLVPIEEAYKYGRVTVLSHDGRWHEANVDYFGEQDVTDITLVKGKRKVKISCTLDHKWFVNGEEFKTTAELIVSGKKNRGDKIIPVFAPKPATLKENEEYAKGVIHGIVYGDGTATKKKGVKYGHMVRLCGDSTELLNYFKGYKHSYSKTYDGDCMVYLYDEWSKSTYLKELPDALSLPYTYGFIKGWLAADGSINKSGQTILASNERGVDWLQRYSGLVGLPAGNINAFPSITNFGVRSEPLYRTYFFHGAVGKEDLLRSRHKAYYREVPKDLKYNSWIVHSVSRYLRREKVYCATVPGTHTFVLKEGIVTGNCSYIAPRTWRDLSEIMYLSMCGTGVGFSVEPENVEKFPQIRKQTGKKLPKIVVEDSKVGWCEAFVKACNAWEKGYDVEIDYSKVRPAGARLKTMGGRASGPGPLEELMKFTRKKILARQNRRLTTIDLHDIICQIGLIVVAGGVRRCLPKNTLVHTKEGLKPVQKIVAGQDVLTAKGTYKRVIAAKPTGQRQLLAINTQLGTFWSTGEHRWATLADIEGNIKWVQAKDLGADDVLLHIPDVLPGRATSLPSYVYKKPERSTTTRDIKIPKLDADIAWLIGYLHGDGYVYRKDETYGELMFACSPDMPDTAKRIKRDLEKFGVNVQIVFSREYDKAIRVRVKSNQLANYFYGLKQPKKSINVPDFILEGLPEIRAAYVAGVFDAGGSIKSRNGKKVRPTVASSVYPDWLRQLRAVLASLGISSVIKQNRPARGVWQALYHLNTISIDSLNAFGKLMESCGSEKWRNDAKHLDRKKEQNSFVVPRHLLAQSLYRSLFDSAYYAPSSSVSLSVSKFAETLFHLTPHSAKQSSAFERELTLLNPATRVINPVLGYSSQLSLGAYLPVKVFGVKPAHVEETYDIQVEGDERFVAEGMLVHNSALISLSALDDADMRDAKKGTFWQTEGQRSMANNSAVYETKPTAEEFLNEWTALVKAKSGERGIFNRGGLEKQVPKRRWEILKHALQPGVNPCVTGDTLVYVADGRGNVPIAQLSKEGKDVPVFCYNKRGKPVVRVMRNPRLTGKNQAVYKVLLDDGSSLRATANHKFLLKSGEYKRVDELSFGDSLSLLTRFEASIKDVFPKANSRSQNYWWVNNGDVVNHAEHRLIAEFVYNVKLPAWPGAVVYHRNFDAQDNRPSNLEIMTREEHDRLHGDKMTGDNNPMRRAKGEWSKEKWQEYSRNMSDSVSGQKNGRFSGITHEELKQHAILLTKKLNSRFSVKDWLEYAKQNNLPQHFSKWRRDHLGGVRGLAKWAASELGLEFVDADPRVVKSYKKYTEQGYDCEVVNNELFIYKQCEVCGDTFITSISAREYGVCSISCGLRRKWQDQEFKVKTIEKINAAHRARKEKIRETQVKIYSDLKFKLGREPQKLEWIEACKENNVSPEISRVSSPFRNYERLREFADMYNHKVLSVEFVGYEDVYNGTVDEFHNFFVGGFESRMKNGKKKFSYLNSRNCGEIILQSAQFCNLTSIVVRPKDDVESLKRKMRLATLLGTYQATLTNFEYLSKKWKQNCEEEQLLGVSITGYYDNPIVRQDEVLKQLRQEAIETNRKYAKRFGKNPSTAITCVKPHGNSGQLLGVGSGMHPWFAPYFIRRVRISATDPLLKMARDQGIPVRPEVGYSTSNASTMVLEFPIKAPDGAVTVKDVTAIDMLLEWKRLKINFTEHNPSATIYVADNEWIAVANFIYENWDIIGGLSFLPRTDHVYPLAPYQEISKEQYEELASQMPEIDFSKLVLYEKEDETTGAKELACAGGICEVDFALEESGLPSVVPSAAPSSK